MSITFDWDDMTRWGEEPVTAFDMRLSMGMSTTNISGHVDGAT